MKFTCTVTAAATAAALSIAVMSCSNKEMIQHGSAGEYQDLTIGFAGMSPLTGARIIVDVWEHPTESDLGFNLENRCEHEIVRDADGAQRSVWRWPVGKVPMQGRGTPHSPDTLRGHPPYPRPAAPAQPAVTSDTSYEISLASDSASDFAEWELWAPRQAVEDPDIPQEVEGTRGEWVLTQSQKAHVKDDEFDITLRNAVHPEASHMISVHLHAKKQRGGGGMPEKIRWNLVFHNGKHQLEIPFNLEKESVETGNLKIESE
ncbi:MAG: hypothetical protein GF418_17675 [Chitinivibrionales bacterium]|nr:hypothetical protein [Chitinivibrionales bacterium]MBD3397452.1 hypothetical protein [Chitinivibrionales bacterium]